MSWKRVVCKRCQQWKPHKAKGLCAACYQAEYRLAHAPPPIEEIRKNAFAEAFDWIDSVLQQEGGLCEYRHGAAEVAIGGIRYYKDFA